MLSMERLFILNSILMYDSFPKDNIINYLGVVLGDLKQCNVLVEDRIPNSMSQNT